MIDRYFPQYPVAFPFNMAIIQTSHLTKRFKRLVAVDDVDLSVEEGECFGLLGPNGAGKTTLIKMITAVSPPTGGDIWVDGLELRKYPRRVKAILGVVPQIDNLDDDLNVIQNLRTFARYFAIPGGEALRRSLDILKSIQLEDRKSSKIDELSGGMKRRLLIGRGLINNPRILILDEPSIGLDPQARHMVWRKLKELRARGVTQLLCTQNMEEAAFLCRRVAVMHQGKIIVVGEPPDLVARYIGDRIWEIEFEPAERDGLVAELHRRNLEFEEAADVLYISRFKDGQVEGLPGRMRPSTLEDVFFKLTGRSLIE
jgi:lipooligosaccharide transport system ATP-binding protein